MLSPRRAVTFDFLGYGRSERSDTAGFTPDDHAAQITAVLDALEIPDAVLVGQDASGPDAVFYTLAHPERVAHLALLNTMFGRGEAFVMPEMTNLLSEPELGTLADDMIGDPHTTVAIDVERLLASPLLPPTMTVSGHVYDPDTGRVTTVIDARQVSAS